MIAENDYYLRTYEKYRKRLRESSLKNERGCWVWLKCKNAGGYGIIRLERQTLLSHRVAYRVFIGAFDERLALDHLCRVRDCINPWHLEPVTNAENIRRVPKKSRCKRGHSLDINFGNVIVKNGRVKQCRTCVNELQLKAYYRRKSKEAAHEEGR